MNHKIGRLVFGFGVGILVAFLAFRWISDPAPRAERALQESVVITARQVLQNALALGEIETVDPLAPNRKVGKSYVYRTNAGWEISGFYRRDEEDRWHAFLMLLDESNALNRLKVQDADLLDRAQGDALLEAIP